MIKLSKSIFIISICTFCLFFILCSTAFAYEVSSSETSSYVQKITDSVKPILINSTVTANTIRIDENYNKKNIILKKGDSLELILPEHSDGGYSWQFKSSLDSNILKIINESIVPNTSYNISGGVRKKRWVIQTIGTGKTSINLQECRLWEKNSTLSTFSLNITVK
ncbi:protease inhibitor I42 family protein [Clostridium sp. WILCCON 0269]|uniref:Protease inhibitor I42 family protein n=1 Tax=Candidatus Clostridium eludens TaxID=3381663 RepID=A0ABW8SPF9_9CLOT